MLFRKIRIGLVGDGPASYIEDVHRAAARIDGRYQLTAAVLSSGAQKSTSYSGDLGIPRSYESVEEMVVKEESRFDRIDAVILVVSNDSHFRIAMAFLKAGINVICDRPLTTTMQEALTLRHEVRRRGLLLAVGYVYSGYAMVRRMKNLINSGILGDIRMVNVEYAQEWLSCPDYVDSSSASECACNAAMMKQSGCLLNLATHAYHTICFVTGLKPLSVAAQLTTFVPDRTVEDNVQAMIRFQGGAVANLWASQVAVGNNNNLNLRIHGERGSLGWSQESPNFCHYSPLQGPTQILTRENSSKKRTTPWLGSPAGNPEGFVEAFAQLYTDFADRLTEKQMGIESPREVSLLPTCDDSVEGLRFTEAAKRSSARNAIHQELS